MKLKEKEKRSGSHRNAACGSITAIERRYPKMLGFMWRWSHAIWGKGHAWTGLQASGTYVCETLAVVQKHPIVLDERTICGTT